MLASSEFFGPISLRSLSQLPWHNDIIAHTPLTASAPLPPDAFKEGKGEIELPDISAPVLERTIAYWMFKVKYHNSKVVPDFVIPEEMALDVLIAADFLQ